MAMFHLVFLISLAWMSVVAAEEKKYVFQTSEENGTAVFLTLDDEGKEKNCEILTDRDLIEDALNSTNPANVLTVPDDDMTEILQECEDFMATGDIDDTVMMGETSTAGYDGLNVIFPGTKWCGPGDIAKHYDDLGIHQDTDRCCRAHDHCNDTMAPGETKNNLTSTSTFTQLSCKCDNDFYSCLERVNTVTSNTIGNLYFNVGKRQCYEYGYPMICKKRLPIFKKCIKYVQDKSKKVYHWVDAKKYKKLPVPGPLDFTLPF